MNFLFQNDAKSYWTRSTTLRISAEAMWTMAAMLTIIVILLAGIFFSHARYAGERGANVALTQVLHQAQTERMQFVEGCQMRAEAAANRQREEEDRRRQAEPAAMAIFQPLPARNSFRSSTNPFARASLFTPTTGRKTEDPRPEVKEPAARPKEQAASTEEQAASMEKQAASQSPEVKQQAASQSPEVKQQAAGQSPEQTASKIPEQAASAQKIIEPRPQEASRQEDAPGTLHQDASQVARQEAPAMGETATGKPPLPSKPPMATRLMGIYSLGRRLKRQAPPPPIRRESLAPQAKASVAPQQASEPTQNGANQSAKQEAKSAKQDAKIATEDAKIATQDSKIAKWDPRFTLAWSSFKRTWTMPMASSQYDLPVVFIDKRQLDETLV